MEHEMSSAAKEKVLGKYKLLSPDFRFFLPMISQKFGGSGSRYILSFPNLSNEKVHNKEHLFLNVSPNAMSREVVN